MIRGFRTGVAMALAMAAQAGWGGRAQQPAPGQAAQGQLVAQPAGQQHLEASSQAQTALKFGVVTNRSGGFEPWDTDLLLWAFEAGLDQVTGGTRKVR